MNLLLKILIILLCSTNDTNKDSFYKHLGENKDSSITVQKLSKKWKLDKYKYSIFSEAPSEKEKNDYIHLKSDMNFTSVSEGAYDSGKWRLDIQNKRIYLTNQKEKGALVFKIDDLSLHQLILIIDDPNDQDAQNLKIYFKN